MGGQCIIVARALLDSLREVEALIFSIALFVTLCKHLLSKASSSFPFLKWGKAAFYLILNAL